MSLLKHIAITVVAIVVSLCCSTDAKGNRSVEIQKIFDVLATQNEKINRLHLLVTTNMFLPKCTSAIQRGNIDKGSKCWNDMMSEIKIYDQSAATELRLFGQLIADVYDGEKSRLLTAFQFIQKNVEKGGEFASSAYVTLLDEMDHHGQLYLRAADDDNGLGSGLNDYTHRVLNFIQDEVGNTSTIFTQKLPRVVLNILTEREMFIRHLATNQFLYASSPSSNDSSIKALLSSQKPADDASYVWKLIPAHDQWTKNNRELYYVENQFQNEILSVSNGRLVLVEKTKEKLESTWAMFYIRLVKGPTGDEVAIQCSYWGIKTVALGDGNATPTLISLGTLTDKRSAIWVLQAKA